MILPEDKSAWEGYLSETLGKKVTLLSFSPLRREKGYEGGLGSPYVFVVKSDGIVEELIVKTSAPVFGLENQEDRLRDSFWTYRTADLPGNAEVLGFGVTKGKKLINLKDATESFVVSKRVKGTAYSDHLLNILNSKKLSQDDITAAKNISDRLVEIHSVKNESAEAANLYRRHIREAVGGHQGVAGVVDYIYRGIDEKTSKDKFGFDKKELMKRLLELEKRSVDSSHRIKESWQRCRRMHGDYHGYGNQIFAAYPDRLVLLDRSRAEFGEPADDFTATLINFVDLAVRDEGKYSGNFEKLGKVFADNYLEKTKDYEMLTVVQPFFTWRGMVVMNPVWYPDKSVEVRSKLFNFVNNVSQVEEFDPKEINSYLSD